MKIRFYLATAIVALSWMGCSQEEATNEIISRANVIQATIESSSRSAVTDAGVFSWTSGDAISVLDETKIDTYTYSGTGDGFNPPSSVEVTTPVVAYYPASQSHTTTSFYLPDSYNAGSTNAAMMATPPASGSTYAFKHLGGVMRFIVKDVPSEATQFVFQAVGKKITGNFSVEGGIISTEATTSTDNQVTINFTIDAQQDMTFYVPLPVGEYEGYQVYIKNGSSLNLTETSSQTAANTISRRTLLLMPTFTCTASGLDKGEVSSNNVIDLEEGSTEATIIGDAEVLVTPGDDADATATLNYTPATDGSSALSISDGSTDGTESGESEGNVIVSTEDASTVASCDINTPSLTVELSAADNGTATYGEVNALTAQQTLIIGEGVTVSNLVVKGGNVIVHGTLSAISRTDDNADEVTYVIYEEEDQIPETTLGENIVAVSAAEYDLIVAFSNGGTVTLDADVTLHKSLILSDDVTLNLDLNNKTLTGTFREACIKSSGNLTISNGNITNVGCAVLTDGGTLKMTDCKVTMTGSYWENAVEIRGGTTAEITGGQYTATGTLAEGERTDWYGIAIVDGTVTLNTTVDGNFNGGVTLAPEGTRPNVTITGGSYSGKLYHGLNMNGGDLTLEEEAEMTFSGKGGDIRVYTLTGTINGKSFGEYGNKTYTLEELLEIIPSAAEGNLRKAIAAGGQVTLETDVTLTEPLIISNDVTLDLNGKTLTGTFREACIKSSGILSISDGYITNVGCAVLTEGGTLEMTDCYVTMTGSYWENAVEIRGGTTAEITGGKYTATGTLAEDERTDWYGIAIVDGTVTLNTTVDGNFNGGVTLAPEGTRPNVTITGGSYSGQMYHGLNMNGGDLTLEEDAEMTFSGKGGDIRVYTKTGKINGVDFGFTLEGKKNYTLEELMAVIAEKKASAE